MSAERAECAMGIDDFRSCFARSVAMNMLRKQPKSATEQQLRVGLDSAPGMSGLQDNVGRDNVEFQKFPQVKNSFFCNFMCNCTRRECRTNAENFGEIVKQIKCF